MNFNLSCNRPSVAEGIAEHLKTFDCESLSQQGSVKLKTISVIMGIAVRWPLVCASFGQSVATAVSRILILVGIP